MHGVTHAEQTERSRGEKIGKSLDFEAFPGDIQHWGRDDIALQTVSEIASSHQK